MNDSKLKASPNAANIERGAEKKTTAEAVSVPDSKNSRKSSINQSIAAFLPVGEENPITAKALTKTLGLSDIRCTTIEISRLRRAGVPICASTNYLKPGYYIAENPRELEKYLKSLMKRKAELQITIDGVQHSLNEMTGQRCLWDGGGL